MEIIQKTELLKADYISFCSMFPSKTANSCTPVESGAVMASRRIFSGNIFLAGGIPPQKAVALKMLPYDGIALVSGIFGTKNPKKALQQYLLSFNA